ncbi:hypothetical protein GCM10022419_000280 [Nonomuraea rosea]|uniref:Uncharacterized protein n=1 Tax=Nonomuraea rosea TaxID=638574 RepID=A0ABP6UYX4_9ACTN
MRRHIDRFVAWADAEARALDLPQEEIPDDPHGPIGTARAGLAHRRPPGGLVAPAIQYGLASEPVSPSAWIPSQEVRPAPVVLGPVPPGRGSDRP